VVIVTSKPLDEQERLDLLEGAVTVLSKDSVSSASALTAVDAALRVAERAA
jgi:hypothetical protein